MRIENDLHLLVEEFVAKVAQLARQVAVDTLASALNSADAAATRPMLRGGRSGPVGGRRAVALTDGKRRTAGDLERLSARFLDHVRANPGQRIEQINRALGTHTPELRGPVVKLTAAKEIKTKGNRRATTYFAT